MDKIVTKITGAEDKIRETPLHFIDGRIYVFERDLYYGAVCDLPKKVDVTEEIADILYGYIKARKAMEEDF